MTTKKPLRRVTAADLYHHAKGERVAGPSPRLSGNCTGLWGDCSGLYGNCSGLTGDLSEIPQDQRPCDIPEWVE